MELDDGERDHQRGELRRFLLKFCFRRVSRENETSSGEDGFGDVGGRHPHRPAFPLLRLQTIRRPNLVCNLQSHRSQLQSS